MKLSARNLLTAGVFGMATGLVGCATNPDTRAGTEQELRTVNATLSNFQRDPEMTWFRDHLKDARAVIISPSITRAGFVFGGKGGEAVVLSRERTTGQWVGPAFYNMGAGSVGFQIGVDISEVIMLVMTEKAVNALLSSSFKLGGDISVAAGPVGAGAGSNVTADVISFGRAKGVYAGISLEGAVIAPDNKANVAFYGRPASPVDILIRRNVESPASLSLRQSLARVPG
jgi:lipid-binding SYLF domain-containing protein